MLIAEAANILLAARVSRTPTHTRYQRLVTGSDCSGMYKPPILEIDWQYTSLQVIDWQYTALRVIDWQHCLTGSHCRETFVKTTLDKVDIHNLYTNESNKHQKQDTSTDKRLF